MILQLPHGAALVRGALSSSVSEVAGGDTAVSQRAVTRPINDGSAPRTTYLLLLWAITYVAWTSRFMTGFRVSFFDRTIWGAVITCYVLWLLGKWG